MWDLPGPGLEPVSPAMAGGFSTTAPPGKPLNFFQKSKETYEKWRRKWPFLSYKETYLDNFGPD